MKIKKSQLEGQQLQDHILKFSPGTASVAPRHTAPLWQDISTFFREYFTGNKYAGTVYIKDAETLVSDLEARFHGTYNLGDIRKMLQTEYKKDPELGYEFNYDDFIKPVTV